MAPVLEGRNRYAHCPSHEVIECLIDCELDERGKVVAGPGVAHGEDMILWGQKLRRAVSRSNREIPEIIQPARTLEDKLVDRITGRTKAPEAPPIRAPRRRPRI